MNLSREQMLAEMGITPIWRLRELGAPAPADEAVATPQPAEPPAPAAIASSAAPVAVDALEWPELAARVAGCKACGLCEQRKQAVLGVGDLHPDWLFIGEGPGAEEDVKGEPFVGQAGKLLDAMLAAIDLERGRNVYIANAVKCRPPGNRTPEAEEMAACWPYLKRQIALIRPKLIVLLGRAALQAVLYEERALGASRGKTFEYRDGELVVPVIVTYHPAYLLRNLPDKAKAWEDLCFARRLMREQQAAGMDLPLSPA